MTGITRPITKHNLIIKNPPNCRRRSASFYIAGTDGPARC